MPKRVDALREWQPGDTLYARRLNDRMGLVDPEGNGVFIGRIGPGWEPYADTLEDAGEIPDFVVRPYGYWPRWLDTNTGEHFVYVATSTGPRTVDFDSSNKRTRAYITANMEAFLPGYESHSMEGWVVMNRLRGRWELVSMRQRIGDPGCVLMPAAYGRWACGAGKSSATSRGGMVPSCSPFPTSTEYYLTGVEGPRHATVPPSVAKTSAHTHLSLYMWDIYTIHLNNGIRLSHIAGSTPARWESAVSLFNGGDGVYIMEEDDDAGLILWFEVDSLQYGNILAPDSFSLESMRDVNFRVSLHHNPSLAYGLDPSAPLDGCLPVRVSGGSGSFYTGALDISIAGDPAATIILPLVDGVVGTHTLSAASAFGFDTVTVTVSLAADTFYGYTEETHTLTVPFSLWLEAQSGLISGTSLASSSGDRSVELLAP